MIEVREQQLERIEHTNKLLIGANHSFDDRIMK